MFFSAANFQSIAANPTAIVGVYTALRESFVSRLGPAFVGQPEENIKLAFSAMLAHEMKAAGPGGNLDLNSLLNAKTLDADGHNLLAWQFYQSLSNDPFTTVRFVGWDGLLSGKSKHLLAETPGEMALVADAHSGVIALARGFNDLAAGGKATAIVNLNSQTGTASTASAAVQNLTAGDYRTSSLLFTFDDAADYVAAKSFPNKFMTPAAPDIADVSSGPAAAGKPGSEPTAMPGGFFSQATLNTVFADPAKLNSVFAAQKTEFLKKLGPSFASLPDEYSKLAFAGMLVYEMRPYGSHALTANFDDLINLPALVCSSSSLLAYHLFGEMAPGATGHVRMLGSNGGHFGNHAQLIIDLPAEKSMIVDTTIGHVALVDSFDALMAGTRIDSDDQASFYKSGSLNWFRDRVVTAFTDGLYRPGNLLYSIDPDDAFRTDLLTWDATPTPQGPNLTAVDRLSGYDILQSYLPPSGPDLSGISARTGLSTGSYIGGSSGSDHLIGLEGSDTLDGSLGDDRMEGGLGDDEYVINDMNDLVIDTGGIDTIVSGITMVLPDTIENLTLIGFANNQLAGVGNALDNQIAGSSGHDRLYGAGGNDLLDGREGDDILSGGAGADTLNGGLGLDSMFGGNGNDFYFIDSLSEEVVEFAGGGTDTVYSTFNIDMNRYENVERLFLVGTDNLSVTGRLVGDEIRGNAGNNTLLGGQGNDTLNGGLGKDLLTGGGGLDRFVFSTRNDSGVTFATRDVINVFAHGDKIDLRAVDANDNIAGDQAFTFIKSAAFSGRAGELRYELTNISPAGIKAYTVIVDTNGDLIADMSLQIYTAQTADRPGAASQQWNLEPWDFFL